MRRAALAFVALALASPSLNGQIPRRQPDFDRMLQQQAETDRTWRTASVGFMQMEKITYRSKVGDMDIPAFVFQPLVLRAAKGHPAIVWVHENIRGHLYEHYIPYIREATAKGYFVIAPSSRKHRIWQGVLRRDRLRATRCTTWSPRLMAKARYPRLTLRASGASV